MPGWPCQCGWREPDLYYRVRCRGPAWHIHEMLFGYLAAVMAGFILTAVPNWSGRSPINGWPLAGLLSLWIAGRVAMAFVADPFVMMAVDLAFSVALAAVFWREVIAGRNWHKAPIAGMLTLFGLANASLQADGAAGGGRADRAQLHQQLAGQVGEHAAARTLRRAR